MYSSDGQRYPRLVYYNKAGFPVERQHRHAAVPYKATVVWYGQDILNRFYGNIIDQSMPTCPNKTDTNVVKTLKPVLCSSDGSVLVSL
jgi:hypothetical protein